MASLTTALTTVSIHAARADRDQDRRDSGAARQVSIHAARADRDAEVGQDTLAKLVSIHAARADRDQAAAERSSRGMRFNPRGPRGPRPPGAWRFTPTLPKFQSTRPARTATRCCEQARHPGRVSIHAARADRDQDVRDHAIELVFQSTRPARTATRLGVRLLIPRQVSIHAARADRDSSQRVAATLFRCFNPRGPRGPRPLDRVAPNKPSWFQSTRPARTATAGVGAGFGDEGFQSTRPARTATRAEVGRGGESVFQSTRPARTATAARFKAQA